MPLEIKELTIKVSISDASETTSPGGNGAAGATPQSGGDQSALVQEVVERVIEILKEKAER